MSETGLKMHEISRGLNLPLSGETSTREAPAPSVDLVAVVAADYVGMRPRMHVKVGDTVKRGTVLFEDRKTPGVLFTSPAGGVVEAVERGERRALQNVVIRVADVEEDEVFESYTGRQPQDLTSADMEALMVESGMWTALRTRPFSRTPIPGSRPSSIFVTAMDTAPLATPPQVVLASRAEGFEMGLRGLVALADGRPVYLCRERGVDLPGTEVRGVEVHDFSGPHPAGTVGIHIHLVDPVNADKTVWYMGYQDVVALGELLSTGKLFVERVVSIGGPAIAKPGLLTTRFGAEAAPLVEGRLVEGEVRLINGSALYGRALVDPYRFLGPFQHQLTGLMEDRERRFLGWMAPGGDRFSIKPLFLSRLTARGKEFPLNTSIHGSRRAVVPFGAFEEVLPFDTHPVFLLRALLSQDIPLALDLGVLDLDEEDLALCTFVCPGKNDYGAALREVLTVIEKEG